MSLLRITPKEESRRLRTGKLIGLLGLASLLCSINSAHAATTTVDFNTDPTGTDLYTEAPGGTSAEWRASGGAAGTNTDGYLSLTDSRGSQRSVLIFKDLENGLVVKSFSFEMDLRIGGGTTPPADGFSINYVNVDDPIITAGTFAGITSEANLPEEGTQTGLAIGFDTWQSGLDNNGAVQDVVGLSIRVDGVLKAQLPIPLRPGNIYLPSMPLPGQQGTQYEYNRDPYINLATNDPNYNLSMQTGALSDEDLNGDGVVDGSDATTAQPPILDDPAIWAKWIKNLRWEHFKAELTENGNVKVFWKGQEVTPAGGLATGFTPRAGRLVFGARTGGSWEATHVDNIKLTTEAFTSAFVSSFRGNAGGFTVEIADQGTSVLDPNSVTLKLNTVTVTPTAVSKVGSTNYVRYTSPTILPSGVTNTVDITYKDNFNVTSTATRTFAPAAFVTVPPEYAATGVNTGSSGFNVKVSQIAVGRAPGDANFIQNAERQFANGFIDPATGLPYPNMASPVTSVDADVINWNQDSEDDTLRDIGNFKAPDHPDEPIPGVPHDPTITNPGDATFNDQNNIVAEITAYLDLPAGISTFGVNSDDGFKVSTARSPNAVNGLVLGSFSGGRGSSDTLFDVNVPTAGIYPVRLLWWEGGGGANVEFFVIDPLTGAKVLVNDRAVATTVKAYQAGASRVPYVSRLSPEANQNFVFADADLFAEITDGSAVSVDAASVTLTVNGTTVAGNGTKNGSVTTIKRTGGVSNLLLPGANSASVVFSYTDAGNTVNVTNNWTVNVVPYAIIPVGNKVAATDVNKTDSITFLANVNQIDRSLDANQGNGARLPNVGDQNRMPRPEMQLYGGDINPTNGLAYPNLADLTLADATTGVFTLTSPLEFNSNPGLGPTGVIQGNEADFPGLPGGGTSVSTITGIESYVAEFRTYLELKAGAYVWAVNSDDGFVATSGPDPHDTLGTLLGYSNVGRGNANPLPTPAGPGAFVPTPGTGQNNFAFGVVVPEDGIYPVRIFYWQGGGGVNMEFLTINKQSGAPSLIGDPSDTLSIPAYGTYTGPARPWVRFSVSPTPWDNRIQQAGPGLIKAYGRTVNAASGGDIVNDSDTRRPWADIPIGGIVANGVGQTLGMLLDGNPVTPTFTTNGTDVTVTYRATPALPSGSSHTASLIYGGTTNSWKFIVQTYTNLNASDSLPIASADASARGFRVKMTQAASIPSGFTQNTIARAEAELAGTLGVPDVSKPGPSDNGTYLYPGIINWNNNRNPNRSGVEIGNFQDNVYGTGWPYGDYPDEPVPGVPGTGVANNYTDNLAAEVFGYLAFPAAGYYRFGVNSDDGFRVQVGTPGQTSGTVIFTTDVGKGSSDIPFSVNVPQAGLYPVRLVYYNGGGGANLEYFSYDDSGNKIPVNDPNNPAAIKAYYSVTGGPAINITSATVSGGQITINWTGGGTLESSPTLGPTANWTTTGDSDGSFTEAATGNAKFYRVKQ
jgi:hypothetical protein